MKFLKVTTYHHMRVLFWVRKERTRSKYSDPYVCVLSPFSRVRLFATLWTVHLQAPLSMGLSRQEYWGGLPRPPPGDLLDPGIEPAPPALAGESFTPAPPGKPLYTLHIEKSKPSQSLTWWRWGTSRGCRQTLGRWWGRAGALSDLMWS